MKFYVLLIIMSVNLTVAAMSPEQNLPKWENLPLDPKEMVLEQLENSSPHALISLMKTSKANKYLILEYLNRPNKSYLKWALHKIYHHALRGLTGSIYSIAISANNKFIVTGSGDNTAKIWDLETGGLVNTLIGHMDIIESVSISPNNKFIVTGSADNTAKIWNLETGALVNTLIGHTGWIPSIAISPDNNFIVTGSCDGMVKIWNLETGACLNTLIGDNRINAVKISSDNSFMVTCPEDEMPMIWYSKIDNIADFIKKNNN